MVIQNTHHPLITIGIPTINRAALLSKSLGSCLNQTYKNIEIIISDNASSDNTEETVRAIKDNRVRYFRQPDIIPAVDNWNFCINRAEGEFFTFISDDDILEPAFVQELFDLTTTYPDASLWRSGLRSIDSDGNRLWEYSQFPVFLSPVQFITDRVMNEAPQFLPGFLCRTENMKRTGGFRDVGFPGALYSDDFFWFRLALSGNGVASTSRILWNYRTHLNHMGARIDLDLFFKNIPNYISLLRNLISGLEQNAELIAFIEERYPRKLISSRLKIEMRRDSRRSKTRYIQKIPSYLKLIQKYHADVGYREIFKNII